MHGGYGAPLSVQHDEADIDRLVANFAAFASAISR